jgi:hypothetical protein
VWEEKFYAIISAIDKRWVLIERRKMKSLRSLEETLKDKEEGRR